MKDKGLMNLNHVTVKNEKGKTVPTIVTVNGVSIPVRELTYHVSLDEVPTVDLSMASSVDIDAAHAQVRLHFDPQNIIDANAILRHELLTQGDYYGGFLGSIESALLESGYCTNIHDLAQAIIDRLIGYEWDDNI